MLCRIFQGDYSGRVPSTKYVLLFSNCKFCLSCTGVTSEVLEDPKDIFSVRYASGIIVLSFQDDCIVYESPALVVSASRGGNVRGTFINHRRSSRVPAVRRELGRVSRVALPLLVAFDVAYIKAPMAD